MSLTITTWNIQNFTRTDENYNEKLTFLVSTIGRLNSDVIALQEVLDENALDDLANRLNFHATIGNPDGRGNRVAFLTRNTPDQNDHIDQWRLPNGSQIRRFDNNGNIVIDDEMPRPALQITIQYRGKELNIITTHLKSKLLMYRGFFSTTDETIRAFTAYFALERRAAEATTIREHISDLLDADRSVIVLGDFNDGSESATTQIFYGPQGSQPMGPNDATRSSGAFQRADAKDSHRLFNITKLVPENIRWTRKHNGQNELLDQILVSEEMLPRSNGLRQVPSMSILNENVPNLIGSYPAAGAINPDHAPVTAIFG